MLFNQRREAIESLAVLPFVNESGDPNAEYLSDGIAEDLINSLSQVHNLRVMARSTVFRHRGKDTDPLEAGKDLRVRAVVCGRLLQRADMMIVRAELIDIATGTQLWGGKYNRTAEDIFALQEDLSRGISEKLRMQLTSDEKMRLTKRYTEDASAYRLYLKGRYHWNKRSPEDFGKAIEYFRQALDKDQAYSPAYAGVADSYAYPSFFSVMAPCEAMPKAKVAAAKGLALDEDLAEAHVSLGYISFTYDGNWPVAGKHFAQALALNPAYTRAHTFYPFCLTSTGRSAEAVDVAQRAIDLEPASPAASHTLAVQLYLGCKFDQAIAQAYETLEMDATFFISYAVLGQAYVSLRMYKEAVSALETYCVLSRSSAVSLALLGYALARSGNRTESLQMVDKLEEASKQRFVPALFVALVYAGLEDNDRAFSWLVDACRERFYRLAYLKVEALWDPIRWDPRFADILRRVGLDEAN